MKVLSMKTNIKKIYEHIFFYITMAKVKMRYNIDNQINVEIHEQEPRWWKTNCDSGHGSICKFSHCNKTTQHGGG